VRTSRQITGGTFPVERLAKEFYAGIAVNRQFIHAGEADLNAVAFADFWIVDPTLSPFSVGLRGEISQNLNAANQTIAHIGLGIVFIPKRLSI